MKGQICKKCLTYPYYYQYYFVLKSIYSKNKYSTCDFKMLNHSKILLLFFHSPHLNVSWKEFNLSLLHTVFCLKILRASQVNCSGYKSTTITDPTQKRQYFADSSRKHPQYTFHPSQLYLVIEEKHKSKIQHFFFSNPTFWTKMKKLRLLQHLRLFKRVTL